MHRKVKIILNPMADMGNAWRIARDLRSITEQHGRVDWSGTVYPGHAIDLAKQAGEQGYHMVIAMGGDGTVHEVINGLMKVPDEKRPTLGVVPAGSGNDFAHALGVPTESDHALVHALDKEPSTVDLGVMTDEHGKKEYFDNTTGIGFDSVVTIRSHKLLVLRGFLIAPEAKIDDGILHYAMIKSVSRPMMFRLIPEVMNGTHGRFEQVTMGSCKKMSVSADRPMYIHSDGEVYSGFGTDVRKVTFELLPGVL